MSKDDEEFAGWAMAHTILTLYKFLISLVIISTPILYSYLLTISPEWLMSNRSDIKSIPLLLFCIGIFFTFVAHLSDLTQVVVIAKPVQPEPNHSQQETTETTDAKA